MVQQLWNAVWQCLIMPLQGTYPREIIYLSTRTSTWIYKEVTQIRQNARNYTNVYCLMTR